jgi:hypothetical protein
MTISEFTSRNLGTPRKISASLSRLLVWKQILVLPMSNTNHSEAKVPFFFFFFFYWARWLAPPYVPQPYRLIVLTRLWKFPLAPLDVTTPTTTWEIPSRERGNCGQKMAGNFADKWRIPRHLKEFFTCRKSATWEKYLYLLLLFLTRYVPMLFCYSNLIKFDTLKPEIDKIYENSIPAAKVTHCISVIKNKLLMLFSV